MAFLVMECIVLWKAGLYAQNDVVSLMLDNGSVSWKSWDLAGEGYYVFYILVL